jgi:RNA polymerase sigma-70 factor, ECF subfamily
VFVVVIREIPRFQRQREGSFRAWLRQVTVNKVRTHRRRRNRRLTVGVDATDGFLNSLADPNGELAREWDLDHDRHVFEKLLAVVQPDFSSTTWDAFSRFAVDGLPAARVAEEMGLSVNAVLQAKSRILKRLREEAGDLLG